MLAARHLLPCQTTLTAPALGLGGFNWVCANALGPGAYSIFGTQLIPWCCGTKEYGRTGWVIGAKRLLRIATEGGTHGTLTTTQTDPTSSLHALRSTAPP